MVIADPKSTPSFSFLTACSSCKLVIWMTASGSLKTGFLKSPQPPALYSTRLYFFLMSGISLRADGLCQATLPPLKFKAPL